MATWGTPISLRGGKGDAGLSVLSGVGAPADSLGFDTQSYISDAGDLYFKSNGTWAKQRSLIGPMGLNGFSGQIAFGSGAPTAQTTDGKSDALYIQLPGGEVWTYDAEGDKTWHDTGSSLLGPQGIPGVAGANGKDGVSVRGTQTYTGSGAPSNDLTSFTPNAQKGDLYYDLTTAGSPYLYVLGN